MAGSFTLDLSRFCQKAKAAPATVVKKACFDMFSRVIQRTPVDTGRARAGWQVGVGGMPSGSDPGPMPKRAKGIGASSSLAQRAEEARDVQAALVGAQLGDTLWLVNNVEYITVLEYDHTSRQAPQGMVRVTITEFQDYVAKAVASL